METGYQCDTNISHSWGQYSPYFSVPSTIPDVLPRQCRITFAQVLSRHGARSPTTAKTTAYNTTVLKIQRNAKNFTGDYAFLSDYVYILGANDLTTFGQQEMVNSGIKFFDRYRPLTQFLIPFVRASSEARVVESAQNFTQGFHDIKTSVRGWWSWWSRWGRRDDYPYPILVLSEATGSNNTLNHGLCTAFENGSVSSIASSAQAKWAAVFATPIQTRLNANLPGANLTLTDTINMMDLCPFDTVASDVGTISPFCSLFTQQEWSNYGYYETLNKYYGYSYGNPLGPTQGVGFTNELIARLTAQPVDDNTSTNHTLDSDATTFPVGVSNQLFADFSHDNDMTAIFSAMGFYNQTAQLSNTTSETIDQTNGYSASWTVPFAARAYFEKMQCWGQSEELVRVLINDRVLPLTQCGGDSLGRCTLSAFVDSLSFARDGGLWDQCFI